ncbi:reverse transcriptase domain-containing protein [Tanacetum coccineum]
MSDNIPPYEIQLEIIKRVYDVKSLIRLRSVSKPWKSYIDSSKFISDYDVRDTQPHRLLLRYKEAGDPYEFKHISFIDDVTFPQHQQDFAPNVPLLVKQLRSLTVIGSSCGLWCLYGVHGYKSSRTEMVVIWNPSIRKSVGIVLPCELTYTSEKFNHFGFGVCPLTNDPTIVIMSYCYRSLERKDTHSWQVQIFTLCSKTWKMIPSSNLPRESYRLGMSTQVTTNRFIFWVSYDRIVGNDGVLELKNLILSFDLITHEFKKVNLLDNLANQFPVYFSISKLRESLVVSTTEVNKRVYGVWMMGEEGGAMTSFKKIFTINTPDSVVSKVLGYKKSGDPIMEIKKDEEGFTKSKFTTHAQNT